MMDRRNFLTQASLAATAASIGTFSGTDLAFGRTSEGKTFVKVFMRGGADGLHLFPMVDEANYHKLRPGIAIPKSVALDMKYERGTKRRMNPNLEPLMEVWEDGRMMVSPATGFGDNNRSHFASQRMVGQGAGGKMSDGYLNRYLSVRGNETLMAGAVLGKSSMSMEMKGDLGIPAIETAESFGLNNSAYCRGDGCEENQLIEEMMRLSNKNSKGDSYIAQINRANGMMIECIERVKKAEANFEPQLRDRGYSDTRLGKGLKLVSQLLSDGVPLEVAAVDWEMSWDMHDNQLPKNNSDDRFTNQGVYRNQGIRKGAEDLLTFYRDMKVRGMLDDVVVLVCTEFGRTVQQNGTFGTDHGHGGAWFAFGGKVQRSIAQDATSLPDPDEYRNGLVQGEDRYIPYQMQYQDIVAEILVRHLGLAPGMVGDVLPGWSWTDHAFLAA